MKAVFLPDTSVTSSLQLSAMYELHALYNTFVLHNVMDQNEAISVQVPNNNVIALHYVLYAWQPVSDLAVSRRLASGLVPLSGIETYSISGSLHR